MIQIRPVKSSYASQKIYLRLAYQEVTTNVSLLTVITNKLQSLDDELTLGKTVTSTSANGTSISFSRGDGLNKDELATVYNDLLELYDFVLKVYQKELDVSTTPSDSVIYNLMMTVLKQHKTVTFTNINYLFLR